MYAKTFFRKIKDFKEHFPKLYISKPGHLPIYLVITKKGLAKWAEAFKAKLKGTWMIMF